MENIKILQVVGYKNSGKTTYITRWVELLNRCGKQVAVIKHHGHGGPLEQPNVETDSMRYLQAGCNSSIVFDDQLIQLHMRQQPPSLAVAIEMAKLAEPELILIEGVKDAHYPKVVLLRTMEDWQTLRLLENVEAVIINEAIEYDDIYEALDNVHDFERTHNEHNSLGRRIIVIKEDDREQINHFLLNWLNQ